MIINKKELAYIGAIGLNYDESVVSVIPYADRFLSTPTGEQKLLITTDKGRIVFVHIEAGL